MQRAQRRAGGHCTSARHGPARAASARVTARHAVEGGRGGCEWEFRRRRTGSPTRVFMALVRRRADGFDAARGALTAGLDRRRFRRVPHGVRRERHEACRDRAGSAELEAAGERGRPLANAARQARRLAQGEASRGRLGEALSWGAEGRRRIRPSGRGANSPPRFAAWAPPEKRAPADAAGYILYQTQSRPDPGTS